MFDRSLPHHLAAALVTCLVTGLGAGGARADSAGEGIIAEMDAALTSATDQRYDYEMVTLEPSGKERVASFTVLIKGRQWRRIDFHRPGDIKGMRVLVRSLGQMYVYLPAYGKVRRVASHVRDQGFMGSSFSHDEMSMATYGAELVGELAGETETTWKVIGRRRPESEYRYPRVVFTIRKDTKQPIELLYFNDKGSLVKSETRSDFACQGASCCPGLVTLVDHTRGDLKSTLRRLDWELNSGLPDSAFSVRHLDKSL